MSVINELSTYVNLIDDLREEVTDERLSALADEQIQHWINRAQERVSDLVQVKEEWILRLKVGVTKYPVQDRPVITNATNATPIVVTSTAHGLSDDNRVTIRGVLGNVAANGRFQLKNTQANSMELNLFADITNASNDSVIIITTAVAYPFASGSTVTISGVTGNTAANGTFLITALTTTTFSIPASGNGAYISGGLVLQQAAGSAVYTAGGRLWKDDELPVFLKDVRKGQRTWSNTFNPIIETRDMDWMIDQIQQDSAVQLYYTDYGSPKFGSFGEVGGARYYLVYPAATYAQDATLFGSIRVVARLYDQDPLTTTLILPSNYDDVLKIYTKMKIFEWLKDGQARADALTEFNGAINQLRLRIPSHPRIRITYT